VQSTRNRVRPKKKKKKKNKKKGNENKSQQQKKTTEDNDDAASVTLAPSQSRPVEEIQEVKESQKDVCYFASLNNLDEIRKLIRSGVNVNFKDEEGRSALHWSVDRGHKEAATLLLNDFKADVNLQDNEGQTSLHYACVCERSDLVLLLLGHGADVHLKDTSGETCLAMASPTIQNVIKQFKRKN